MLALALIMLHYTRMLTRAKNTKHARSYAGTKDSGPDLFFLEHKP